MSFATIDSGSHVLLNINPLLTGELLKRLDEMGHSDRLVIADANFPARRIGPPVIDLRGVNITQATSAICEVFPLDPDRPPLLMDSELTPAPTVQDEIVAAIPQTAEFTLVDRWAYYDLATEASVIISTGEIRLWANVILAKGLVEGRADDGI